MTLKQIKADQMVRLYLFERVVMERTVGSCRIVYFDCLAH